MLPFVLMLIYGGVILVYLLYLARENGRGRGGESDRPCV